MKNSVQGYLNRQYLCVLRRCAWNNAFSYFIGAAVAVSGSTAFADSIVPDGRTQTQLSVNGAVTDVTTQTVRGANAINSFHRFNIGNGQTVNLYLPTGTANLLNLVHDERSQLDGVMNAYKDGRIGGNVFFLNPHGIVVGAGGVLNVGSLTMATPTSQFMDSLIDPSGLINDGNVNNVLTGYIPLTDTGLIQVKGRINAANTVNLMAGQVAVDVGAHVVAGPQVLANFADLVNIQDIAVGSAVEVTNGVVRITAAGNVDIAGEVSTDGTAGNNAGSVDIHADADINVTDGAKITASGQGLNSSGGNVKIYAEGDATLNAGARITADGGTSGDGGFVEFSAKNNVTLNGGQLSAEAPLGLVGTVLIDPTILNGSGFDYFIASNYILTATDSITLSDVVISTRNVADSDKDRTKIEAAVSKGNSGSITLTAPKITLDSGTKLLANATDKYTAGNITLTAEQTDLVSGFRNASANTSIVIDGATLKGGNVSLKATSKASYTWGGSPLDIALMDIGAESFGAVFSGLSGFNIGVAISKASSEVLIKAGSEIDAQGAVELASETDSNTVSLKAGLTGLLDVATQSFVSAGFTWGEVQAIANVDIASGATIKADKLDMSAINRAATDLTVIGISKDKTVNAAIVVNKANVDSKANIAAGATINAKDSVSILAHNENQFSASASSMALGTGQVGVAFNYTDLNTSATASNSANLDSAANTLKDVKIEALDDTVKNISLSSTTAGSDKISKYIFHESPVDSNPAMTDQQLKKFESKMAKKPLKLDSVVATDSTPKLGAAVTYANNLHNATAYLGDNTVVNVAGDVVVAAKVNDEHIRTQSQAAVAGIQGDPSSPGVSLGLSGAVAIGMFEHNAKAYIGDNAKVTAQHVGIVSDMTVPYEQTWYKWEGLSTIYGKLNGNLGIADGLMSGWSNSTVDVCTGTCIAGSLTWIDFNNSSNAYLGRNATVTITPTPTPDSWASTNLTSHKLQDIKDPYLGITIGLKPVDSLRTQNWASPFEVLAKSDEQGVYLAGNMTLLFGGTTGAQGAAAAGASYNQINYDTTTRAWLSEGAVINSNAVTVKADSSAQIMAITPSSGKGASYGASMIFSKVAVIDHTEASIDDEAKVTAKSVNVDAANNEIVWALTGAVTEAEGAGVGLSLAINDVSTDTQAKIADNDGYFVGGSLAEYSGKVIADKVAVTARTDGRIEAIAVAAAQASSSADEANARPRSNATTEYKADSKLTKVKNGLKEGLAKITSMVSKVPQASTDNVRTADEPTFGIAVSGSSAVNLVNLGTHAYLDGATIEHPLTGASSLVVSAVNDTDITAATGSAALTRANNPSSKFSAGVAGSVAVNLLENTTEAYLKDSTDTNAHDVSVTALAGGEQLAIAIGLAVNTSADQKTAKTFAGSVSVSQANNTVSARVENSTLTGQALQVGNKLDVLAYDRIKLGTGGGSLIVGGKGGIGAAVTYSEISNTTEAILSAATVSHHDTVTAHALTATKIVAGGAMAGGTWADDGTTLGGAFVISDIGNTVNAEILNGSEISAASEVDLLAADTTGIVPLDAVIDVSDGGRPNASSLDFDGTTIGQTAGAGSSIISVAGVVQAGKSNVGASFVYNKLHNNFTAAIRDSNVSASDTGEVNVVAESNANMLGIGFGVGVATNAFSNSVATGVSGSGSLALSEIENVVAAEVTGTAANSVTASTLTVKAEDKSSTKTFAGNISASFGDGAVGASVAVNNTTNKVSAKIENFDINVKQTTRVTASNDSEIQALAATAGYAKGAALNGAAVASEISNTTEAYLLNAKSDDTTNSVGLIAEDHSRIDSLAGAAAFSGSNGGGAGVVVNQIGNKTDAYVAGGSYAIKDLAVFANSSNVIRGLAVGVGAGKDNGVGGSISVNLLDNDVTSSITSDAVVVAENNVGVAAQSDDRIAVAAGSIGIGKGGAGIGVSFTVNSITGDTKAFIDGQNTRVTGLAKDSTALMTLNSGALDAGVKLAEQLDLAKNNGLVLKDHRKTEKATGVAVNASSTQQVENISANLAGGSKDAAGLVESVNVIGGSTQAYVLNAKINNNAGAAGNTQSVEIKASNVAYANSFIGGVSIGGNAGGAGEDLHAISRTTLAYAAGGSITAKDKVSVSAIAKQGVSSIAVGGAVGGGVAAAGTLSMVQFNNLTEAFVDATSLTTSNLAINADNINNMYVLSGAVSVGSNAAGGAFAVGTSNSTTRATLKDVKHVDVSKNVSVEANNTTDIHHIVVSGAGGGADGIAGMADVNLVTDKTEAKIENSEVGTANDKVGSVHVGAKHTLAIDSKAGALGVGISGGGVGAGASVNIIRANTTAIINDSNIYSTEKVDASALSVKHVNTTALTAGVGGTTGIGGAIVLTVIGDDGVVGESAKELKKSGSGTLDFINLFATSDKFYLLASVFGEGVLSTAERYRLNTATSSSTNDVTDNINAVYKYRTAAELTGTNVIVADSFDAIATDKTDTKTLVGGFGASLGGGVGGGVAETVVKAKVEANVSGTSLTTNGNIKVTATADNDVGKTIDILALAGGAGPVGIGAAASFAVISNDVDANLLSGANAAKGTVTVSAEDKTDIDSDAKGAAVGSYAAGIVVSKASKTSIINAAVGGTVNAAGAGISATDSGFINALGQSAAGGMTGAGSGAFVSATDGSTVSAITKDNTTFNLAGHALNVTATATPRTESEADGVAVSGGLAIGASLADATINTTINATLGANNTVNAGGLSLTAQQLRTGGTDSAKATAWAASGGLLLGVSATESDADAIMHVYSRVGDNSTLNLDDGTATVTASVDSQQESKASGINAGVVAAGFNNASATSKSKIYASLGSNVKVAAGTLKINSGGTESNFAKAIAGSGGVLAGSASKGKTDSNSDTRAYIEKSNDKQNIAVKNFDLTADHTAKFNSTVDSTNASVVGASGASADNLDEAKVWAGIGDDVNIEAVKFDLNAYNRTRKTLDGDFNVVSASGGLFDSAATHTASTVLNDTDVNIGKGVKIATTPAGPATGHLSIKAENDVELYDSAKMDSGGAIALAKAEAFVYNDKNDADITLGQGTVVISDNDIVLETLTNAIVDSEVSSKTYGLAGAAQGHAISRIKTSNNITLNGARLESDENVILRAGYNNNLKADAETRIYNRTLIPADTTPDADGIITQNNKVTVNAYVPKVGVSPTGATSDDQIDRAAIATVKDIYLQSGEGIHAVRGYGKGTDLYREIAAEAASLIGISLSTEISGGSVSDNSQSSAEVNGTLFAGTHFHQFLHIDARGNITKQSEGMANPTYVDEVDLKRDISARIDVLNKLYEEYKDDQPDIANGFKADADILEAKKTQLGVGAKADFIYIQPAVAYTGNIIATGDSLFGTGELLAPGDSRIEVINDSTKFLNIVGTAPPSQPSFSRQPSLYIPDELGGVISLNGVRVSTEAEIDAINQRNVRSGFANGKILDRQTSVDPVILVRNTYEDTTSQNALNPEIHIDGDISNIRGLVKIDSTGTIQIASKVYAKTVDIKTKGDFIQLFTTGFTHTGGDPTYNVANSYTPLGQYVTREMKNISTGLIETVSVPYTLDLYYEDLAKAEYPNTSYTTAEGRSNKSYSDSPETSFFSSTIAGNSVFISGEKLNINSLIQSGLPTFTLDISQAKATEAIARANDENPWVPLGMMENNEDVDALFQPKIKWNNGQIELQSIAVGGGYMQLYGDIFSTGNGKLKVLDGYGKITVNNNSIYNLAVNRLDTGPGVAGKIKITDTSTKYQGEPLITTITRVGDTVTASYENMNLGDERHPLVTNMETRTAEYAPRAGRRLHWLNAEVFEMYRYESYFQKCFLNCSIGDWLASDPGTITGSATTKTSYPRIIGEWLEDDYRSRTDSYILDFERYRSDTTTTGVKVTNSDRSGVGGANLNIESKNQWWWDEVNFYNHSLYASVPIQIEFTGFNTGLLTVNAGAHDLALNGAVRNLTGTTNLTANNISAASLVVVNAKDLNLTANAGNIGTASLVNDDTTYLKVNLQTDGKLDAVATGSAAIWEQDGALAIKRAQAGEVVNLKADGDLLNSATGVAVSGSSIRLTSVNGAIGSGTAMLVDTKSSTGNLSAAAAKDIAITESTGDLRLNSVTTLAGDVTLTANNGNIVDDNSISRVDLETTDQLIAVAERAGLFGDKAKVSEENSVNGYNQAKEQDYAAYWQMRNVSKTESDTYVADDYAAGYTFKLGLDQVTELKNDLGWTDTQIADYETKQTQLYHDAHAQFGAEPYNSAFTYYGIGKDTNGAEYAFSASENLAVEQEYQAYWQLRNVHKDGNDTYAADAYLADYKFTLSDVQKTDLKTINGWNDLQVKQYEDSKTALYHEGYAEFGDASFDKNYNYDVAVQDVDTYKLLTDGTWKLGEVTNLISAGIFKDTPDTEALIENDNIVGHNITLNAINGGIGAEKDSIDISFDPLSWDKDKRLALVVADRNDVTIDYDNKKFIVRVKDDIDIALQNSGELTAHAASDIYIGSEADIRVKEVIAPDADDVRIKTGAAIINVATAGSAAITGLNITVEAGGANLGSEATPFILNALGSLTARADGDLFVNNFTGDMRIEQIYATNLVKLTSVGGIFEQPYNHNLNTDIQAKYIDLTAATTIGQADITGLNYLDIGSDNDGWVDMTAADGIYVYSPAYRLNLRNLTANNGSVNVTSAVSSLDVIGNVTAKDNITLDSAEAVWFDENGRLESTYGDINISTSGFRKVVSSNYFDLVDNTQYGFKMDNVSSINAPLGQINITSDYDMFVGPLTGTSGIALNSMGDVNILEQLDSDAAISIDAANNIQLNGGSITSQGAVTMTAGKDGTGSIHIGEEKTGGYAVDTASTFDVTAANDITITGRIRALGNTSFAAGDNIQLTGGSLTSDATISLIAGTDGTGSADIGVATDGGNAIYTPANVAITAADDINISGDIRSDVGLILNAIGGTVNLSGGTLSTGGLLEIAANNTLTIAANIFGGAGVGLTTPNDVVFTGGSVASNNDVTIIAGTDGSGSIFGSPTGGVDIVALGELTLQAPDSIGAGAPVVAQVTSQATLLSSSINADISTTPLANPLLLSVSDIGGGPAANVLMNVASGSQVTFNTFNVGVSQINSNTPSLQVPNGNITNYAVFNMPAYSTRIDTLSRVAHPGYNVNGFTLGGAFNLSALINSVSLDTFILIKDPYLQVAGNFAGNVEDVVQSVLQLQQFGVGANPLQFNIGNFGLDAPSIVKDGSLVDVNVDWLDISLLAPNAEDEKEKEI